MTRRPSATTDAILLDRDARRPGREVAPTCLIAEGASPRWAFVRVGRNLWVRAHVCVALVACPSCKAKRGALCLGRDGLPRGGESHWQRRGVLSGRCDARGKTRGKTRSTR
jgi:hypothetical protein